MVVPAFTSSRMEMEISLQALGRICRPFPAYLSFLFLFITASPAQGPAPRITTEIDNNERAVLQGSHPPMAQAEHDSGPVPQGTKLQGVNIVFSRSAAQEADLETLITAQQDISSPLYHKWLTPEEFAARFGVADSDLAQVKSWLEHQGFTVEGISRSKTRITFSGTAGQVEAAFGIEMHNYN